MKKSEAVQHLQNLRYAIQKLRSILREDGIIVKERSELLGLTEEMASHMWPYVWGDRCLLPILERILDDYDEKEQLLPLDFYNQVVIATHLEPMLVTITNITLAINGKEPNFPEEVDINWLKGWDKGGII